MIKPQGVVKRRPGDVSLGRLYENLGVFVRLYEDSGVTWGIFVRLYEDLGRHLKRLWASSGVFFVGASLNHPLGGPIEKSLWGIFISILYRHKIENRIYRKNAKKRH